MLSTDQALVGRGGNLYVSNFMNGKVIKITTEGETSQLAEVPGHNNGHIFYHERMLHVAALNHRADEDFPKPVNAVLRWRMKLQGGRWSVAGDGQHSLAGIDETALIVGRVFKLF